MEIQVFFAIVSKLLLKFSDVINSENSDKVYQTISGFLLKKDMKLI